MAGYLVVVSYKSGGVSKEVSFGIDDGLCANKESAIAHAVDAVTSYRTSKGETPVDVVGFVSEIR